MKSLALKQWEAAAYAAGRLTQLRRVVKPQPVLAPYRGGMPMLQLHHKKFMMIRGQAVSHYVTNSADDMTEVLRGFPCPYGVPGDRLALREGARMPLYAVRWHPVITAVRLERVQDITEADAQACGCDGNCPVGYIPAYQKSPCVYHYAEQFTSDNPRTPWDSNPWVWVYEVERVKA